MLTNMQSLLPFGCMFSGVIPRVCSAVLKQFLLDIIHWCTKLLCGISQLHLFPLLSFPEVPSFPSNTPHRLPILFTTFPEAPLYTHCRGMPALFPLSPLLRAPMPPGGDSWEVCIALPQLLKAPLWWILAVIRTF